ncbi:MAG: response regulator transcription factor [Oscillospiraceae bacterium]
MKILIIEDEADILRAVAKALQKQGYQTDSAEDGDAALELFFVNEYDLIVLDINLPYVSGLDILKKVREKSPSLPVIIMSAMGEWEDKVKGLDLGANDYLAKPFHIEELLARVRANIRASGINTDIILRAGSLLLDGTRRKVSASGVALELTRKEFDILEYLLRHKGRVCTETDLLEHVWASDTDMFSNAVKVHISTLRKKLCAAKEESLIVTVRGHGYKVEDEKI